MDLHNMFPLILALLLSQKVFINQADCCGSTCGQQFCPVAQISLNLSILLNCMVINSGSTISWIGIMDASGTMVNAVLILLSSLHAGVCDEDLAVCYCNGTHGRIPAAPGSPPGVINADCISCIEHTVKSTFSDVESAYF